MGGPCQHRRLADHRLSGEVFELQWWGMDKVRPSGVNSAISHRNGSDQRHELVDQGHGQERRRHQPAIGEFGTRHAVGPCVDSHVLGSGHQLLMVS